MRLFSNWKSAFARFFTALTCMVFGVVLSTQVDAFKMLTDEFKSHSFLYKETYLMLVLWQNIFLYVSGLILGESSLVAAGFSYRVENGVETHNAVKVMNLRKYMLATDLAGLLNNWNV